MPTSSDSEHDPTSVNSVYLRGRLAEPATFRELPSGDVLAVFRLKVPRPAGERGLEDSLECATTRLRVHRTLQRAAAGEELEVIGSLRRRFWRSPAGPASRYSGSSETRV